jgi:hypothetical protein
MIEIVLVLDLIKKLMESRAFHIFANKSLADVWILTEFPSTYIFPIWDILLNNVKSIKGPH